MIGIRKRKYICQWWDLSCGFLVGEAIVVPTAPLPLGLNKCQSNYFVLCLFSLTPSCLWLEGLEKMKRLQNMSSCQIIWCQMKTSRGTKYESKKMCTHFDQDDGANLFT